MRRPAATTAAIALLLAVLTACAGAPAPAPVDLDELESSPTLSQVSTIGALGDSMTLGVNACAEPGRCTAASWATGDEPAVGSVAMRIGAANGSVPDTVNAAKDGGTVADAVARVDEVIVAGPELVLVLLGGNDVCAADVDGMTSVDDFRASYTELLAALSEGLPDARVLALSIPDLHRLWEVGRDDEGTRQIWDSSPSCSNLLGDAAATDAAATERHDAVAARTDELNGVIAEVCAADSACVSDGGAVFAYEFSPAEISAIDHFHPSVAGQQVIAQIAWDTLVEAAP